MILRYLSIPLIVVGFLLIATGMVVPWCFPTVFVSQTMTDEYTEAATAYHNATNPSAEGRSAGSVDAARQRFEKVRTQVDTGRQRQDSTGWTLTTAGFALLLVGALLRRSTQR
jgi:uncharacterized membrane protein